MTWRYIMGRLPDSEVTGAACTKCGQNGVYRVRAIHIEEKRAPEEALYCVQHAAGFAHRMDMPFPPGMWDEVKTNELKHQWTWPIPAGTRPSACRGCGCEIYWITTERGRPMPVEANGTCHFITCPEATGFRKVR